MPQNGNPGPVVADPEEQQRVLEAASSRPALAVLQAAGNETHCPDKDKEKDKVKEEDLS